jgi:hypothetical protein
MQEVEAARLQSVTHHAIGCCVASLNKSLDPSGIFRARKGPKISRNEREEK